MPDRRPLVLVILDGWGYREENEYNAIAQANTPQWDSWWDSCPHILLEASGKSVGLPDMQMGNSEVGHMHIGAGRVIQQDLTRINDSISSGEFTSNPVLQNVIDDIKTHQKTLHIMGLLSSGGVHSHEDHLLALIKKCSSENVSNLCLHLFLDGRDTPPQSALDSIKMLNQYPEVKICSITGRYYSMDRDQRWERIQPAYELLTENKKNRTFSCAEEAINYFYSNNITDEFIPPTQIGDSQIINDGDAIIFFNFRADRARQLTKAFIDDSFTYFKRNFRPKLSHFISMAEYSEDLATEVLFPPTKLKNTLGEVISNNGMTQLRVAETEKYAHVTFFLNGGDESIFKNETRNLVPSPAVKTYDLQPEMSADKVSDIIVNSLLTKSADVIICNFANADMVGHTGNISACIQAIEALDKSLAKIFNSIKKVHGQLLITADHGNAELMFDRDSHQAHTAHTTRPVPLLYVGGGWQFTQKTGSLIDIAPTVLALLGINQPSEMTGNILLQKNDEAKHE